MPLGSPRPLLSFVRRSSSFSLERCLESLAGGVKPPFGSPFRDTEQHRDLGDRSVLDVVQDEDRALVWIEAPECATDNVAVGLDVPEQTSGIGDIDCLAHGLDRDLA